MFQYIREKINLWRFNYWNKSVLVTPKISQYVDDFATQKESESLKKARDRYEGMKRAIVQSEPSQAHFIAQICKISGASNVLEIGTFRGYTTAVIATAIKGKIYTCETNPYFMRDGIALWSDLGLLQKIEYFIGKAYGYIQTFDEEFFDCIFIDADKKDTMMYVRECMPKLKLGGVMVVDNVLWRGLVVDKNPIDTRARALKKINEEIRKEFSDVVIVPAWDGIMLIVKS